MTNIGQISDNSRKIDDAFDDLFADFDCAAIGLNQSFPPFSDSNRLSNEENWNSFSNRNSCVDIDLADNMNNFSLDDEENDNLRDARHHQDISMIASYFGKKSSSLSNLITCQTAASTTATTHQATSINNDNNNVFVEKEKRKINLFSALPLPLPLPSSSSSSLLMSSKSVYFVIARHTKFDFDFFNISNLSAHNQILMYFKYSILSRTAESDHHHHNHRITAVVDQSILRVELREKLCLEPNTKLSGGENLGHLIARESGKFCLRIFGISIVNRRINSIEMIDCYLDIVDIGIALKYVADRRIDRNSTIELIQFDSEDRKKIVQKDDDLEAEKNDDDDENITDILIGMSSAPRLCPPLLDRPFVCKLSLSTNNSLITFAKFDSVMSTNLRDVEYHFVNRFTILVRFVRRIPALGFTVSLRVERNHHQAAVIGDEYIAKSSTLSIFACDQFSLVDCDMRTTLLASFPVDVVRCTPIKLDSVCVQATLRVNNNDHHHHLAASIARRSFDDTITADRWKRIVLRNKNRVNHVKIAVRHDGGNTLLGKNCAASIIECTPRRFALKPLERKAIFVRFDGNDGDDGDDDGDDGDGDDHHHLIKLYLDQFGGIGRTISSVVCLKVIKR